MSPTKTTSTKAAGPSRSKSPAGGTPTSARTPQPSVIPIRLEPAPRTKTQRAAADALGTFHRGHLDELVGHYGLPINRVVQIALRQLHRQVFPGQYGHDDTSQEQLAAEAALGMTQLTASQAAAVLANAHTPGVELAKKLGLPKGETLLTLADFFARAEAGRAQQSGQPSGRKSGPARSAAAGRAPLAKPAGPRKPRVGGRART